MLLAGITKGIFPSVSLLERHISSIPSIPLEAGGVDENAPQVMLVWMNLSGLDCRI